MNITHIFENRDDNILGRSFYSQFEQKLSAIDLEHALQKEISQMQIILLRYRAKLRQMIRQYREWQNNHDAQNDDLERIYSSYEGIFVRRQLRDSITMYLVANREYHEIRRSQSGANSQSTNQISA